MKFIELPPGEGQVVYINPDELYIKPEWIDKELNCICLPDVPISQNNPVYEAYKKVFKSLFEKGYKVITDAHIVDDAFFLTPCLDKHFNSTKEEYDTKKKSKIFFYLSVF